MCALQAGMASGVSVRTKFQGERINTGPYAGIVLISSKHYFNLLSLQFDPHGNMHRIIKRVLG